MNGFLMEFILTETYVIIPVLWVIGLFLKRTPIIKDWLIPYILLALGFVCSFLIIGFTIQGVLQGILVTGVAVLGHQLFKQANKGRFEFKKTNGVEFKYSKDKDTDNDADKEKEDNKNK